MFQVRIIDQAWKEASTLLKNIATSQMKVKKANLFVAGLAAQETCAVFGRSKRGFDCTSVQLCIVYRLKKTDTFLHLCVCQEENVSQRIKWTRFDDFRALDGQTSHYIFEKYEQEITDKSLAAEWNHQFSFIIWSWTVNCAFMHSHSQFWLYKEKTEQNDYNKLE